MLGIYLNNLADENYFDLIMHPADIDDTKLTEKSLIAHVKEAHPQLHIIEDNIKQAYRAYIAAKKASNEDEIVERVAEKRDAEVRYVIASDEMSATLEIICAYGGKHLTPTYLKSKALSAGIERGLSTKRLIKMATEARTGLPGAAIKNIVAIGLPAREGKSSRVRPLVPNALERILRPQSVSNSRVDMRDLGEIICVKPGTEILERRPPTKGRAGYTVRGGIIDANSGEWHDLKPGAGTYISDDNPNILRAEMAGMPKFQDGQMWVDDTLISKGVNIGTGNVNYDGSVIVTGDVTEKMKIVASGDITINGFVESAHIEAGGDIIITQGAMGKYDEEEEQEYSGKLIAQGSIHIEHGQGLDILCSGNVTVGKQLAYSRILCQGSITVGPIDNPNGNLFACEIQCQDAIRSGSLGAVSGSHLFVDFSAGYNLISERIDTVDELLELMKGHVNRHQEQIAGIKNRKVPKHLLDKLHDLLGKYRDERTMLQQLMSKAEYLRIAKAQYIERIQLNASKNLYPGVVVKLNNRTWKADREYANAKIHYHEHQWQYDPL
ncbi:FapA family protein [Alteromonadaceae bacterium BrNp21-10]|nr:FapA family protein [Alteromonadaceae bacterium BrNp21-10]